VSYTMLTQNCDQHPVLSRMHKPDPALRADQQDKRTIVSIERADWQQWLRGTAEDAMKLVKVPACELRHGPVDEDSQVQLALV
jgi:putative SOS response-associated peptidase YedK